MNKNVGKQLAIFRCMKQPCTELFMFIFLSDVYICIVNLELGVNFHVHK